jgi:hypothetical protein
MPDVTNDLSGTRVLVWPAEGPAIRQERDPLDVIGDALAAGPPAAFLQELVNHRVRVAIVGDLTAESAARAALRDFVAESKRGRSVWFVVSMEALARRLHDEAGPAQ